MRTVHNTHGASSMGDSVGLELLFQSGFTDHVHSFVLGELEDR